MTAPTTLPEAYDLISQLRMALLTAQEHITRDRDDFVACCSTPEGMIEDPKDQAIADEYNESLALIESALARSAP